MSCLGVHFALTEDEAKSLCAIEDEQERLSYIVEDLEDRYLAEPATYAAQSDKAWDAMHRTLADGYLNWDGGQYPLNHVVLAGELLYTADDYIMSLKNPAQVRDIAAALEGMTENDFRERYNRIPASNYDAELGDADFAYTWSWFQHVRELYRRAAAEGRPVLFTADQ
jgi:hypothetical protein